MLYLTEKQIDDIAGDLECGLHCHVNIKTGEYTSVPNELIHIYTDSSDFKDEIKKDKIVKQ